MKRTYFPFVKLIASKWFIVQLVLGKKIIIRALTIIIISDANLPSCSSKLQCLAVNGIRMRNESANSASGEKSSTDDFGPKPTD